VDARSSSRSQTPSTRICSRRSLAPFTSLMSACRNWVAWRPETGWIKTVICSSGQTSMQLVSTTRTSPRSKRRLQARFSLEASRWLAFLPSRSPRRPHFSQMKTIARFTGDSVSLTSFNCRRSLFQDTSGHSASGRSNEPYHDWPSVAGGSRDEICRERPQYPKMGAPFRERSKEVSMCNAMLRVSTLECELVAKQHPPDAGPQLVTRSAGYPVR
jgi:hypothetical protein